METTVTPRPPSGDVGQPGPAHELVRDVLKVARAHLGMEVAFVGRVTEGRRWIEYVDSDPAFSPVRPGDHDPLDRTYCGRVLAGRLPSLVPDAAHEPAVADLEATWSLPVGSHLTVPIRTAAGRVFGTLCCFSRKPRHDLTERGLGVLTLLAELLSTHLETLADQRVHEGRTAELLTKVLDEGGPKIVLQRVVELDTGTVCGYEALSRFPAGMGWSADRWFREAERVGMGVALETAAAHAALRLLRQLPPSVSLAVNVSAAALMSSAGLRAMFSSAFAPRLVIELTEHQRIEDPEAVTGTLQPIRAAGARVAVDDAGSGYAGLEHILNLRPDVLKLDRALVHGIADHPGRQAMCEAMVRFTERTGARLVAEGVEDAPDLQTLRDLRVGFAQGYLLGRPAPWPDA